MQLARHLDISEEFLEHEVGMLKAYMDDNLLYQSSWLGLLSTQLLYHIFTPMGLKTAPHTCCNFYPAEPTERIPEDSKDWFECCPCSSLEMSFLNQDRQIQEALPGVTSSQSSWTRAARAALRDSRCHAFIAGSSQIHCSRDQLTQLAYGHNDDLLVQIISHGCSCKSKTGLIFTGPLTKKMVRLIDILPMGAMVIKDGLKGLGLPIIAPTTPSLPLNSKGEHLQQVRASPDAYLSKYRQTAAKVSNEKIKERTTTMQKIQTPFAAAVSYTHLTLPTICSV